jgi:hypothetical protein
MICLDPAESGQVPLRCQVTTLLIVFFFGQPQRMLDLFDFVLQCGEGLRLVSFMAKLFQCNAPFRRRHSVPQLFIGF